MIKINQKLCLLWSLTFLILLVHGVVMIFPLLLQNQKIIDTITIPRTFQLQMLIIIPFILFSTFHLVVSMSPIMRVSLLLMRALMIQMVLIFFRETSILSYIPAIILGIEAGIILSPLSVVTFGLSNILLSYLFGQIPSVWNIPLEIVHVYHFFGISLFSILGIFLGAGIQITLVQIDHATQQNLKLQDSILTLTQANVQFIQYAATTEIRSKEEERSRITRDIHDSIGYVLTNILAMSRLVGKLIPKSIDQIPAVAKQIETQAFEGITQMRGAVRKFRATLDSEVEGTSAVIRLIDTFSRATGIEVAIEFTNVIWTKQRTVDEVLYHIVQESLTNAFRHGNASKISIIFSEQNQGIKFEIQDNGIGASIIVPGVGIEGMHERAKMVGGFVKFEPVSKGFRITGWVPV